MYKHSIVYGVGLILTDSMPVAHVCDVTSFAIVSFITCHFGQRF